jgi:ubiquinone/menaquinone biosynthesis C-methylase UbiE
MLELTKEDSFLDAGCGAGAAVRDAAGLVERAVGLDLSPGMLARARTVAEGLPKVEFHEGDASGRLPFADGEFTALLCTTAFHHFPDPRAASRELARVLAPGGRLVIGDPNADLLVVRVLDRLLRRFQRDHVGFFRAGELVRVLGAAGLSNSSVRTLWRGGYALVRAEKPATGEPSG